MVAALFAACAESNNSEQLPPPATKAPVQISAQLIIKFTPALTVDQIPAQLEQMSRQHAVEFQLVREMAGGAFVIKVGKLADERHLNTVLDSVQKRDDVEYVEIDARMHHQSQP